MATDNQTLTTQPRQQILLTIVVPVRNRPQLIVRTLDSIVSQTCRDFNLIVVDDGSTDSTPEVVAAWMKANDFRLPAMQLITAQGAGAPAARNLGLEAVST
ncbi:MAG: glycosyltransferase family 2 protein, partial [Paramuribaculum sp.]|nr:glycosyltransferase family 2 protein [Paramuribaculum sp.]